MLWRSIFIFATIFSAYEGSRILWGASRRKEDDLLEYEDIDYLDGDSASYESNSENDVGMNMWRRHLKQAAEKLKNAGTATTSEPETVVRRSIPTPAPPIPPDVEDITSIRKNLEGRRLGDTAFSNTTHFKMAVTFMADDQQDQPSKDLTKVICLMDCQIAAASQLMVNAGFRGKDEEKHQEQKLEHEWNNMTEIEREFIEAITAENVTRTRRASKPILTKFQKFSDWCTSNCDDVKKKYGHHEKKHKKKQKHTGKTTPSPDDVDYESEEEAENPSVRRAEENTNQADSALETGNTQIPLTPIIISIFGEKIVSSLSGPTLCLCGTQTSKICYCQSGKKSPPLVPMTPSFD